MEIHPAANIFPIEMATIKALADDIKKHGQKVAIKILDGKLIDGRRRLKACQSINIEPKVMNITVEDPIAYVCSLNLMRRQLTTPQRAMVAARCKAMYEAEAKERIKATQFKKGQNPRDLKAGTKRHQPTANKEEGRSHVLAAKAAKVGATSVVRAARIIKHGNKKLIDAVDQGLVPIATAIKQIESGDESTIKLKPGQCKAVGLMYANKAIAIFRKIPVYDPEIERAIQVVSRCLSSYKSQLKEFKNG